jgi:N-acetylglucosaminyldiphosphoundecaprenol N-acetyl-beta-D-mannosaminyltransferase
MGAGTGIQTVELPPARGADRANVLGCDIDRVDLGRALAFCEQVIESRGFAQHMAINVAKLVAMRHDEQLRWGISRCELITADGQPVVWASRLLRDPLPSRVAGIDLMEGLLALAEVKGYRVYILGARQEVLERAVERIRARHPEIAVVGYRDGYYDEADEDAVADAIALARPDVLFVAMSSPRKEYFLSRHGRTIGVPFVMGVGGAVDVMAGLTRRAPLAMQRSGLEWLFRFAQEPRRLGPRYASTNTRFVALLSRELVHAYWARHPSRAGLRRRASTVRPRPGRRRPGPARPVSGLAPPASGASAPAPSPPAPAPTLAVLEAESIGCSTPPVSS